MIKLIYETPPSHQRHTAIKRIEIELDSEPTTAAVIEAVQSFLEAVGYVFQGKLEDVTEEVFEEAYHE